MLTLAWDEQRSLVHYQSSCAAAQANCIAMLASATNTLAGDCPSRKESAFCLRKKRKKARCATKIIKCVKMKTTMKKGNLLMFFVGERWSPTKYQRLCEINFGEKFVDDTRGGAKESCPTRGRLPLTVASGGKSVRRKEIVLAWFAGEGMFTMATPRR